MINEKNINIQENVDTSPSVRQLAMYQQDKFRRPLAGMEELEKMSFAESVAVGQNNLGESSSYSTSQYGGSSYR